MDPKGSSAAGEKRTLVEEGTELRGSLTSTCPVLVRGRIDGEVSSPALTVSPTGAVHGRAKVGDMRSEGELGGQFEAETVHLSGKVLDKTIIKARSLEVKLAASDGRLSVVFGECELDVGDAPNKADDVGKGKKRAGTIPPPKEGEPSAET